MNNEVIKYEPGFADKLISKAIEKNVDVGTLERLMALRQQLQKEYAEKRYYEDLARFQESCPPIPKSKEVKVKTRLGAEYSYHYAPLDIVAKTVKPYLEKYGFSYFIKTETNIEEGYVTAIAILHHRDGHSETSSFTIPIDRGQHMNDMQKVESSQTYAKRIAFVNLLGLLEAEEDTNTQEIENNEKEVAPETRVSKGTGIRIGSKPHKPEPETPEEPEDKLIDEDGVEVWLEEEKDFNNPML